MTHGGHGGVTPLPTPKQPHYYLESSNRANDRRYERLGFELIGEFAVPGGSPTVGRMWRDPR